MKYLNESTYDGEWNNCAQNGKGTFTNKNIEYKGDFKDGVREGKGWQRTIPFTYDGHYYEEKFMKEISKDICIMEREFLLGKVEVNMKVIFRKFTNR